MICAGALSAERLQLNLATQSPGEVVQISIDPTSQAPVELLNQIPSKHYTVTVTRRSIPIPPLERPKAPEKDRGPAGLDPCQLISDANTALFRATAERQVPDLRTALESAVSQTPPAQCTMERETASDLLRKTAVVVGLIDVGPGEELEVRVERTEKEETLVWRKTFSTGPLGTWLTTYGFNFIPSRDKRYFLEPTQEGGSFKITRDTDRRELDFSPSIYFSWMPSRWRSSTRIGPSAGLGFDLSAPIVFAGLSILYNWNLGLFFGGVIHQQSRLRGEFEENATIRQNLTPENLVEKTYVPNFVVGVTFRFGGNPFPTKAPPEIKDPPTATPTPTPVPSSTPRPTRVPTR